ncbi:hypothetical protein COL154_002020 [Colletotrichum chrysophilum]|uniref:Uncharacterized protein n=1 Tax=Colletotrichum chrysophilum TaxID=1836956 RepID=A0AAD9ADT7_9PEZI|nr:hypothetical protein KNSL1_001227 [Colletotrichum chrysophilum]KAJ0369140.1 hypothetical protein COL154_002020 [Colletotrichum chrysophilum]KAK1845934.1 hypothetical protein CCHR01_11426 [Colletotrichum chrysophilum]
MVKVKPGKLLPPDPRPWTADPEHRKMRKTMEKESPGFDWGQAIALGMIGATVMFGIDKSLKKCEERHEEEDRREERRRDRESRSRPRRATQSVAGSARESARESARGSTRGSRYDRDERRDDRSRRDEDEDEYWDRYYEEREAIRAARDYSREPARAPESIKGLNVMRDEREYVRAVDQFDRDYGYGRRYDDQTRSRSNPGSRSRGYSNW